MQQNYDKHPILQSFDRMLETLPYQLKLPLPAGTKLQFTVTTRYYQELLQVENDDLVRPVSPTDVMRYKDCFVAIDDRFSSFTLAPLRE